MNKYLSREERFVVFNRPKWEHELTALREIEKLLVADGTMGDFRIFLGYYIENDQKKYSLETDALLICHYGVFVIELKDSEGEIKINPLSKNMKVYRNGKRRSPKNPVYKVSDQMRLLGNLINDVPGVEKVHSMGILLFTDKNSTVSIESSKEESAGPDLRNEVAIGCGGEIVELIKRLRENVRGTVENRTYSDEEILQITKKLDMELTDHPPQTGMTIQKGNFELFKEMEPEEEDVQYRLFKGREILTGVPCVIKEYLAAALVSEKDMEDEIKQLMRDASALSLLGGHQNLVHYKGCHQSDDGRYLYLAYGTEQGSSLADIFLDQYSLREKLTWLQGISNGLCYVHDKGMIHRALKPSNILITPFGPKIMNFDLARIGSAVTVMEKAQNQTDIGYMAPEVPKAEELSDITSACDIYSLGKLYHYVLTGRLPFVQEKERNMKQLSARLGDIVPVNDEFDNLVERMLARKPTDRPTAHEVHSLTGREVYRV